MLIVSALSSADPLSTTEVEKTMGDVNGFNILVSTVSEENMKSLIVNEFTVLFRNMPFENLKQFMFWWVISHV